MLKDDTKTRIQIDQQHTVARDFLTQFSASLRKDGVITQEGEDHSKPIVKYNIDDESTERTSEQGSPSQGLEPDLESEEILSPEESLKKKEAEYFSRIS